jgi:uncharacterized OB-fold protein
MTRTILRAALYQPAYTDGTRRVHGPDEDPFTMAASALERAVRGLPETGPEYVVRYVGPSFTPPPGGFAAILGRPVVFHEVPPGLPGLSEALVHARQGTGPELVVGLDLYAGAAVASPGRHALPTEGAVALLIDEPGATAPATIELGTLPAGHYLIPYLLARQRGHVSGTAQNWIGDWSAAPTAGIPAGDWGERSLDPPPIRVSEGAYFPSPRYLEGLASRWRFIADRCAECRTVSFPSRGRCKTCGRTDRLERHPLALDGAKVVARTWIGSGGQPTEFDEVVDAYGPYGVVIAEVEPGVRATLPVADAHERQVQVNDIVGTRLRRLYSIDGQWRYGRKAVPLTPTPAPASGVGG